MSSATTRSTDFGRKLSLAGLVAIALALHAPNPSATEPNRVIFTIVGGGWPTGVPAVSAPVGLPFAVAADTAGNVYIGSSEVHRVFKVDASGDLTVLAGNGGTGFSGDGGPAVNATVFNPWAVAVDQTGNVFIAEQGNRRVRRVDTGGTTTPWSTPSARR